ncbi:serine/threonine-protein kinase [Streptomyces sp. NPDC048565]|uniref:serine/threonine-protein kinase n=1 Tax=Streptomyces sp. NPDC048565 TaxID=3155266 RepID=UPI00343271D6
MLHVPLHRAFRYIHEPLPIDDASIPVLGHEALVAALRERLMYSHGGTFLVTGFRGVGKTTLVTSALAQAASEHADTGRNERGVEREVLLTVHLSLARRMEADQLLFAVVRRIFETLDDQGLFQQLPSEVRRSLLLAYTRTSLSFTQTQSEGSERAGALGFGPQQGLLGAVAPTVNLTGKKTRTRTTEAAFLAYSETDVEHDLVRIIQLLSGLYRPPAARRRALRRRAPQLKIHPVIVLDEVDKLTDDADGAIDDLERLIGSLKSVLTTRGAHFIVVAGPDLHDRALADVARGNGLYESVFAWQMYVPCLWQAPERLVQELVRKAREELGLPPMSASPPEGELNHTLDLSGPAGEALQLSTVEAYLRFKARGVLRRLLQEFNSLIMWDSTQRPSLHLNNNDWQRALFYGHLDTVMSETTSRTAADPAASLPIDEDRRRLGGYHVADWALRSRGRVFTAEDVTGHGQLDPLLRMDNPTADELLRQLVRGGVLDLVSEPNRVNATQYGNPAAAGVAYYKLANAYSQRVAGFAQHSDRERADLGLSVPVLGRLTDFPTAVFSRPGPGGVTPPIPEPRVPTSLMSASPPIIARLADRYEVRNLIGSGGMGAVHRGRDLRTGEDVAIKLLHRALAEDGLFFERFRREGEIGLRVRHPNVVRTIAAIAPPQPAIVMELIEGPSLDQLLSEGTPLRPVEVARIGWNLGEAIQHLHSLNLSRFDLKPSNIIDHPVRGGVIIDLGLTREREGDARLTQVGHVVGTVAYMAPEQLRDALAEDIRSDLYALGTVLYQCITGRPLYSGANVLEVTFAIIREPVSLDDLDLPVSTALRNVVVTCLAPNPADRYQEPSDYVRALAATPEYEEAAAEGLRSNRR